MEAKIIDANSAKGKAKSIEERIAFLETQSSPECKPSKSSEAKVQKCTLSKQKCSTEGCEERIDILPHSLPECKRSNSTIQVSKCFIFRLFSWENVIFYDYSGEQILAPSLLRIYRPPPINFDPTFMKDAQCAETNEKTIFRFLFFELFLFFSSWICPLVGTEPTFVHQNNDKI